MVDWNKEISFGRKNEPAEEPEAVEETQSLEPVELPEPEPVVDAGPQPEPAAELEPEPIPEPEPVLEPVAEDKPEKSSLMKKEISLSFRRKPKEPKLPKFEENTEPEADAHEKPARKKRSDRTQRGLRRQGGAQKRAKRVVGLKIGASQLAAARIVNNGQPELVQVARETSRQA